MGRRRRNLDSPYSDQRSRRSRRKNRKDQYGIYEIPDYRKKRSQKKKNTFSMKNVVKELLVVFVMIILVYGVSFGVKWSMLNKGISQYEQEDFEGAVSLFTEALKPKLPLFEDFDNNIRFYLADCYVNMGKYGDACYEYSMIKLWKHNKMEELDYLSNVAYGLQLYEWKEYREALPILLQAYEDGYSDLVLYVGSCYGQTGDLENMQIYYDVFLRNNEMNSFMYAQYAAISLDEGNLEQALSYIEQGKQLEDQSNMKELLFDEIVYYEKMRDYNTAFQKAKNFIENYPNDTDGRNEYDLLFTRQNISEE